MELETQAVATISAGPVQGALVNNIYAERSVMTYAMQENDLVTLGLLTTISAFFLSIATGIAGFMASVWYQSVITNDQVVKNVSGGIVALCEWALGLCLLISVASAIWRFVTMKTIKKQSRQVSKL